MTYKMYMMDFQSAHFGSGKLDTASLTFSADRLFSALVLEAIKADKLDDFLELANRESFVLSDAFPYKGEAFLPKPIGYPSLDKLPQDLDVQEMRQQAKKSKKLNYISLSDFENFLNGHSLEAKVCAKSSLVTKNQPLKEGGLFQVGTKTYAKDSKLYVIAEQSQLFDLLMTGLQYSGIGGKRSSGYGHFDSEIHDLPSDLARKLTQSLDREVMLLTSALPVDDELEAAMAGSKYLLTKSSGFAFSTSEASNYRKQDLYKFKVGSTFSETFRGQIVDVRPKGFPHPVLNFAKPLFYKLEV